MRNSNGKMEVAATTLSLEQEEVQLTASPVVEHSLTSLALPAAAPLWMLPTVTREVQR
jgi:hypothetical protein